jgi:hypothetical protein
MTPAEFLLWEACNRPPTTAEWLTWLRRTNQPKCFLRYTKRGWVRHRRLRPFICPMTLPLYRVTCGGYWWVPLLLRRMDKSPIATPQHRRAAPLQLTTGSKGND